MPRSRRSAPGNAPLSTSPIDPDINLLRESLRNLAAEAKDEGLRAAALRLTCDSPELQRAWREIGRRAPSGWMTDFAKSFDFAWSLAHVPYRTRGQAKTAAKKCVDSARRTAALIRKSRLDWNAGAFMDDHRPGPLEIFESLVRPTISDVLLAYADTLDDYSESMEFMIGAGPSKSQPQSPTATGVALVRQVAEWLERLCGSPLYRTTGAIAGIALGLPAFDQEYVKGVIRRQRRP